jgi:hypothetical protein
MANRKISDLAALTAPATGDLLPIVDISEAAAADKNKKITFGELLSSAPAGSAAAPSFSFDADPNTGIFNPAADTLAFAESGVEAMRIDSSGRVGIGTSAPLRSLSVVGTGYTGTINISDTSGGSAYGMLSLGAHGMAANDVGMWRGSPNQILGGNSLNLGCRDGIIFAVGAADLGSQTERMRIKSTGIVNIANTPTYADNAAATSGGLAAGDIYRKSDGTLMIRY